METNVRQMMETLDEEWKDLIRQAKDLDLSVEEVRAFLRQMGQPHLLRAAE